MKHKRSPLHVLLKDLGYIRLNSKFNRVSNFSRRLFVSLCYFGVRKHPLCSVSFAADTKLWFASTRCKACNISESTIFSFAVNSFIAFGRRSVPRLFVRCHWDLACSAASECFFPCLCILTWPRPDPLMLKSALHSVHWALKLLWGIGFSHGLPVSHCTPIFRSHLL